MDFEKVDDILIRDLMQTNASTLSAPMQTKASAPMQTTTSAETEGEADSVHVAELVHFTVWKKGQPPRTYMGPKPLQINRPRRQTMCRFSQMGKDLEEAYCGPMTWNVICCACPLFPPVLLLCCFPLDRRMKR